jgi:uncharacterized protein (TIGR02246 family)
MTRLTLTLAVLIALVRPAAAQAPLPHVTVHNAVATWVEAFNSRDPQQITALYAANAVFWGTTARTIATSREEIWAYFKDAASRPDTRVTIDSEYIRVYGDVGIASGAYTFIDVKDGGRSNVRPARFTFVFKREGERWLIVEHHSSRVPD